MPDSSSRCSRRAVVLATVAAGVAPVLRALPVAAQEPLRVVATFSILGDWVQQVGGDRIALTTIVPAGGDTHTFDPNPEQVASIAEGALVFEIGLGFESWLDDMVEASGTAATRVVVSDGVDLLSLGNGNGEEHEEEGDNHGEHDPHIWGDARNAIHAVTRIGEALAAADPDNAAAFTGSAATYSSQLEELHATITSQAQSLPENRRKLVTTHDTFGYYARAYGFAVVGTALSSLSTDGGDASAGEIADLVTTIQEAGVPAIFAENVSNSDVMEVIADEAGVTLAPTLYSDALGEPGTDGDSYVKMMTWNTETIVTALGQS